jgi:serine/threonine protein kinase
MKICRQCERTYPRSFAVCPRDGAPLSEQGEWSEGTMIRGKYRIIEKLGQGAMGAVYKAMHVRFKELRALKVMAPELIERQNFCKAV